MDSEKNFIVFTGRIARALLRKGYTITDIQQHKDNHDKTVFYFRDQSGLKEAIYELSQFNKNLLPT